MTNEQMTLVSQFVHQPSDSRPCACFLLFQQRVKFVGIACFTALSPDVRLHERQTFGHTDSDALRLLALRSRFMSGNKRLAASSATTSAKEFASMWWTSILFCLIAVGPTSSKCNLTLMTSVKPLRVSINWKRIDHKSPFGPLFQVAPVCDTFHHTIRIYRNLDVRLFV